MRDLVIFTFIPFVYNKLIYNINLQKYINHYYYTHKIVKFESVLQSDVEDIERLTEDV